MRRRLLLVFAVMGAVAIAGFAVPLALVASDARTRELVLERESDVQRFAVLADEYVRSGDAGAIGPEVDAYYAVYGEPVLVVSTRGVPDYSAGMHVDAQVEAAIERGLRNERGSGVERLTPFSPDTELFVRPVGTGAQVNGVVVIEASTAAVQRDVARSWAMIAAGLVAALAAFAALALALSRWVLRPLSNLSDAMSDLAARLPAVPAASARHDEDVPPHPSVAGGPPEIRRLAETFDGLFATVLRSVAAQRRLVADASHQLRNPLAALQLRLDTIEPDIPDSAATDFRFATDEAQRLHEILDALLVLAAAETPGPIGTPDVEGCNLYAAAIERVEFWAAVVGQRGGTLSVDNRLDDVAVRVTMSESDLSQILDVLIDNASRHGGTHPTIVVTVGDGPKGTVDITVTDDGPGVATEDRSKLTSRFYSSGTGSGSGLGLSIVDVVVRAAGGLLEFGDSPAGGLLVRVRLAALGQSIELEEK